MSLALQVQSLWCQQNSRFIYSTKLLDHYSLGPGTMVDVKSTLRNKTDMTAAFVKLKIY